MYQLDHLEAIQDPQRLHKFIEQAESGELEYYFPSSKEVKKKFTERIVGETFEK
jgi:hypothetical protein